MKMLIVAATMALVVSGGDVALAQSAMLRDSTGQIAGRPISDTMMLVVVRPGVIAPALIRPVVDADGRVASGVATWAAGGSVLFTSDDCTSGAHVYSTSHAGVRATSQLETATGTTLYVGAIGNTRTMPVRSILYSSGCAPVALQQSGLVPVDATVNLTTTYPPPLSIQ